MIIKDLKFDFDDLLIAPRSSSNINSRKDVNVYDNKGMLPLFTAPMDTVVEIKNMILFEKNKIYPIIPRTSIQTLHRKEKDWFACGLKDFEDMLQIPDIMKSLDGQPYETGSDGTERHYYVLVDIANGHMKKLADLIPKVKSIFQNRLHLMVGNVANPKTYKILSNAGADYVRIGIGNGGGCLTSQNVGVGYPLASLIAECYEISCTLRNPAKIVADGGMKNYSDIIKALALGADYVMLGSIMNKALESAGETFGANIKHENKFGENFTVPGEKVDQYSDNIKMAFLNGAKFNKKFRGMSTKGVQKLLGNENIKTSEGVTRMNPVEYTIEGWVENFTHYLASAMSYTGSKNLDEFIGKVDLVRITQHSFNRFNK